MMLCCAAVLSWVLLDFLEFGEDLRDMEPALQGDVGFFYLEGHGVPAESPQQMHGLAKEFFSLPAASKEQSLL